METQTLPKYNLILGPMFAGKSTLLMSKYKQCATSKSYFKFTLNEKNNGIFTEIKNHDNLWVPGVYTTSIKGILNYIRNPYTLFIDEIQFAPDIENIKLLPAKELWLSGLNLDYKGNPFTNTTYLVNHKANVLCLSAKCSCGRVANRTKLVNGNPIGGFLEDEVGDSFKPVCEDCFYGQN